MIKALLKPFSFAPAIFLMYIIFSFSAANGTESTAISGSVTVKIVSVADKVLNLELTEEEKVMYADRFHYPIRKIAHMTEYAALAVAIAFPMYVYGLRGMALVIVVGGFCVGFAGFDEYHQSFVAGRQASKKDVAIDTIGILVGIIIVRVIGWTGRMTIFRSHDED